MITSPFNSHARWTALMLIAGASLVGKVMGATPNPSQILTAAPATAVAATPDHPASAASATLSSYDVGLVMGDQLTHDGLGPQLSIDALVQGIRDALGGRNATPAEHDTALSFMHDGREALAERNRTAAKEFLEHNGKQPGIVTLPSGLQYKVLAEGSPSGRTPAPTDQVTVRYTTSLADGTEIDRSDSHGRPASFRVNTVFKAWQEALAGMKPGAKWQLFVPPDLGYGKNTPPPIPPGSLLIYEFELLQVEASAVVPMKPRTVPNSGAPAPGTTPP